MTAQDQLNAMMNEMRREGIQTHPQQPPPQIIDDLLQRNGDRDSREAGMTLKNKTLRDKPSCLSSLTGQIS